MCDTMSDLFDIPVGMVPSGEYMATPLVVHTASVSITNPFFSSNSPVKVEQFWDGDRSGNLIDACKRNPDIVVVNRPLVLDYSAELIKAARVIKELDYDLVLCPLRGARLAGVQSSLICDNPDNFAAFDGTDMSRGNRDDEIKNALRDILLASPSSRRTIGVLDHAKGGHGCEALTRLLSEIHSETDEEWGVDFHLMHAVENHPSKANKAYQHRSTTFQVQQYFYPVTDLLVEDEDKLLGYGVHKVSDTTESFRFESEGQILYVDGHNASLLQRAPLDKTLFGLVANEVGHTIAKSDDMTLIVPDYWKRFE
jgi:hypothetical protein